MRVTLLDYRFVIFLLSLMLPVEMDAQRRTPDVTTTQSWTVVVRQGISKPTDNSKAINCSENFVTTKDGISSMIVKFDQGELVIDYWLKNNAEYTWDNWHKTKMNIWSYDVSLSLTLNGRNIPLRDDQIYGDHGPGVIYQPGGQQLRVTDLIERYGLENLTGELEVQFVTSLDLANCENKPKFSGIEIAAYSIVAVGSGALIYEAYQANSDARRIAGISLLVIDAGIFTYRIISHKKKMRMWDDTCNDKARKCSSDPISFDDLRIRPYYDVSSVNGQSHVGLRLNYTF